MISGNVEQVAVAVGDTVSAGDLLCRFDDESARLSLQNAQAAANSAQESYNSAVSNYGGTRTCPCCRSSCAWPRHKL